MMGADRPHGPNDGCGELLWEHMSADQDFDEEMRQAQAELADGRGVPFRAPSRVEGLDGIMFNAIRYRRDNDYHGSPRALLLADIDWLISRLTDAA